MNACTTYARLSPRVELYDSASARPSVEAGWLALPQLPAQTTVGPVGASGGRVFGDGSHPTTRLCAGVMDLVCRQRKPEAVLDVGTGTGVLARIARARGAKFIVGTDIDPTALACARAHAALDERAGVAGHAIDIHFSADSPDYWGARFDLIVANILEQPLRELAPALSRAIRKEGVLLLSGFMRPQTPALRVHYEAAGFAFVSDSCEDGWALLRFSAPASA
jgi:ribosomal protein L11 methyltransferase